MADGSPNLFLRLHKWAARQDENFLTESLAILLQLLLERDRAAAVRLVARLTGGFLDVSPERARSVTIVAQPETDRGRPDIEIRTSGRLACVEVKSEADVRIGQLEGYRVWLRESGVEETCLILLSRYPPDPSKLGEQPDVTVRWFQVAEWVGPGPVRGPMSDEPCQFLCDQFHEFLRARNMAMAHVSWQMSDGLRAVRSLLDMVSEAAAACRVSVKRSAGWDYIGFSLDSQKYWVGLNYDEPDRLWFGTRCRIDPAAAAALGVGHLEEEHWVPGGVRWWCPGELTSEEVHFYVRSKASQMQWLEVFLQECLTKARSIETPDQPPIPDDPEE